MMKFRLFYLMIFVGLIPLKAQFNPEVRSYLDDAMDKLKTSSGVQMHYRVNDVTHNQSEELAEGTVYMKGDLYRVESEEFMVVFDGTDQWIYRSADKELMIQSPDSSSLDENNPVNMLTSYKSGFKFDLKQETDSFVVVNMIAQDPYSPYIMVTVKLNKVKKEFVSLQMLAKDESAFRISLNYESSNKKFSETFFNFNALGLPVNETVDLRENY